MGGWTKTCQLSEKVFSGAKECLSKSLLHTSSFSISKNFQGLLFNCLALLQVLIDKVKVRCLRFCFSIKSSKKPTDIKEQGKSKSTLSCMLHTVLQFASKNFLKDEFSQFLQF